MILSSLRLIFKRDLTKLKQELTLYKHEKKLWNVDGTISNSGGNLCLHLVGNLNTYIGATLGNTGYIRDRAAEFGSKNISRDQLIEMVDQTLLVVDNTLANLQENELAKEFPVIVFDAATTTGYMLMHLAAHLGYHLGQLNYHRRLLDC